MSGRALSIWDRSLLAASVSSSRPWRSSSWPSPRKWWTMLCGGSQGASRERHRRPSLHTRSAMPHSLVRTEQHPQPVDLPPCFSCVPAHAHFPSHISYYLGNNKRGRECHWLTPHVPRIRCLAPPDCDRSPGRLLVCAWPGPVWGLHVPLMSWISTILSWL